MKIEKDMTKADFLAKANCEPFEAFVDLVQAAAVLANCPGYALLCCVPTGLSIVAGGMDDDAVELCRDMATRLGAAMVQRLEESEGATGLPT